MTNEEAVGVAEVLSTVDGGCSVCAHDAAEEMAARFPGHPWGLLVEILSAWDDARPMPAGYERPSGATIRP